MSKTHHLLTIFLSIILAGCLCSNTIKRIKTEPKQLNHCSTKNDTQQLHCDHCIKKDHKLTTDDITHYIKK